MNLQILGTTISIYEETTHPKPFIFTNLFVKISHINDRLVRKVIYSVGFGRFTSQPKRTYSGHENYNCLQIKQIGFNFFPLGCHKRQLCKSLLKAIIYSLSWEAAGQQKNHLHSFRVGLKDNEWQMVEYACLYDWSWPHRSSVEKKICISICVVFDRKQSEYILEEACVSKMQKKKNLYRHY